MAQKRKKSFSGSKYNFKLMLIWVGVFAAIGVGTLLLTKAATPGITVTVDSTLPNPTNVKVYGDDRVATVTWAAPSNAGAKNIVGYYVTWGAQGGSVTYTNARQTTYEITQIQPLVNGTAYNVKVQSVQGSTTQVPTPDSWNGGTAPEARANGSVSSGVTATVTPSSSRVDALRTQMTGFFDDFNTPSGAMDELKWNTAAAGCSRPGSVGAFLNNQFHVHSQVRSSLDPYCDRASVVSRARPTFDISGRTEADPGVIVGDFDGTSMESGRDTWYIDLVPLNVRANGAPLDITSHADSGDTAASDPSMIRISQNRTSVSLSYTGKDKVPHYFDTYKVCPDFKNDLDFNGWCSGAVASTAAGEWPVVPGSSGPTTYFPTPNVRFHWRVEVSSTQVKVFLNGVRILQGAMPTDFVSTTKYSVQSNLFSYNTGKDAPNEREQTSIIHWDNFGFNGPASSTVVHNYIEGSATGTLPVIGTGTITNPIAENNRTTKINIPDPINSPAQARLMYTLQDLGDQDYTWKSSDTISVNGHNYPVPEPMTIEQAPHLTGDNVASKYIPYAESIVINAADLKQGSNDVTFTLDNSVDMLNVHVELEYTKGSEPAYTSPTTIYGAATLLAAIQPTMLAHDSYLFVEQDMGLPSGVIDSTTPVPPPPTGDTTPPTIVLNAPADNTIVTSGASVSASAGASDNVGVTKVEFYIGNTLKATDTASPYDASLATAGLAPGTYSIKATAYDAAGNSTSSALRNIIIQAAPDTTAPSVSISSPTANTVLTGSANTVVASATDATGVTKVEFYIDNQIIGVADTSSPYSAILDSTKYTNGTHALTAKGYDAANNIGTSATITISVNNAVADTTPPTVTISAPVAAATISGKIAFIQATASDAGGINRVEFYIDGALLGSDNAAPYSFSLDTTQFPNGAHTLVAKAFDTSNNQATSSNVAVSISNADTTLPSVVITAPFNNTTISGSYTVSATAADAGGIAHVDFSVDAGAVLSSDTTSPYSYSLDTTKLTNAAHSIKVTAYDTSNSSNIATANVTVNNTVTPPTAKKCDFNNDTFVDTNDLFILLANFNKTVPSGTKGDCSADGTVDINDLFLLLGLYGK
jgi:Bacterial Ig domain/Fibronectin type III domain